MGIGTVEEKKIPCLFFSFFRWFLKFSERKRTLAKNSQQQQKINNRTIDFFPLHAHDVLSFFALTFLTS